MNILIAGGSGFLGRALTNHLARYNHRVFSLTRKLPKSADQIHWNAQTTSGWQSRLAEMDAVINVTGFGLDHWPWTQRQKRRFIDSRVIPGRVLAEAFEGVSRRPSIFVQASGINRYGLHGEGIADESTPPSDDFLGQLTVKLEDATNSMENLGVRRVIIRAAVVLARHEGQFPLMTMPVRLFFGGRFGDGKNSMNWIHIKDFTRAVQFLLENEKAHGPYNLLAPSFTSGEEFMRSIAKALRRPFWFHVPKTLLQLMLGEMHVLLTEGRRAQPKRLSELGFQFEFGNLEDALKDLLRHQK
jgi:uncharacterized protein (TIGR01777 family)